MATQCPKCKAENPDTKQFCGDCGTQLSQDIPEVTRTIETPAQELTRGTVFADRYEIIESLGIGGMGKVYRVFDKKLEGEIALKLIKPEIASDRKTLDRFRNEIKLARDIAHRNVCRMYELMDFEDRHFITMEYVSGQDLKGLIRQTGQLAMPTALSITKQICEGLSEAHRLGVVHRDLKPSNIMIDKQGSARIMDFGIARSLKTKGITRAGAMIGTPEYISPEQVEGKEVDQRSDLYSLGVILYEMVTGSVPFEGETPLSIARMHADEEPQDPKSINPQISDDLSHLILRCLEKDKENRYQSAGELITELGNIEKGMPSTAREIPKRKPVTSREITVTLGLKKIIIPAVVVLALLISMVFIFFKSRGLDVDPNRVVVAAFENKTGDTSLDSLGGVAADWITQEISQTGLVEVVLGITGIESIEAMGIEKGRLQEITQLRTLAKETGAGIVVSGAYYLVDDALRFQTNVTDVSQGKIIYAIQPIIGQRNSPKQVIAELYQRIMGALALHFDPIWPLMPGEKPPKFEAYQEFKTGIDSFGVDYKQSLRHFLRAREIDPTFDRLLMWIVFSYGNDGRYKEAVSFIDTMNQKREKLIPYYRSMLDFSKARYQGHTDEALRNLRQALMAAPYHGNTIYLSALYALRMNRPQETVDIYEEKKEIIFRITDSRLMTRNWIYKDLSHAHHMLGNYEKELEVAIQGRKIYPELLEMRQNEIRALVGLGKIKEVQKIIDECASAISSQGDTPGDIMVLAARELYAHDHEEIAQEIADRAVRWYQSLPSESDNRYDLAEALYVAKRWDEAKTIFKELTKEDPENFHYKGYLGTLAARSGEKDLAQRISLELGEIDRPYLFGRPSLWCARISALLGENQRAVEFLRDAFSQGLFYTVRLHRDMDLEPLRDYPLFIELLMPKG
jgi:tetratricopeptide (TPR) repeat protein